MKFGVRRRKATRPVDQPHWSRDRWGRSIYDPKHPSIGTSFASHVQKDAIDVAASDLNC